MPTARRFFVGLALLSLTVGAIVFYALTLQSRSGDKKSCEQVNVLRAEFNERAEPLRTYATILIAAREGPDAIPRDHPGDNSREVVELKKARSQVQTVSLTDCDEAFPRPWPFG